MSNKVRALGEKIDNCQQLMDTASRQAESLKSKVNVKNKPTMTGRKTAVDSPSASWHSQGKKQWFEDKSIENFPN